MDTCIIKWDSCSNDDSDLVKIKDKRSWDSLVSAARLRNHDGILEIERTQEPNKFPEHVKYHRYCRQMFTMKRDLENLKANETEKVDTVKLRTSGRLSNEERREFEKLPKTCIFCKKDKFMKSSKTREKLRLCQEFRADETMRKAAVLREDADMLAICSDELIAKEAMYHHTCYKNYVKVAQIQVIKHLPMEKDADEPENRAYGAVLQRMYLLLDYPEILEFMALTEILETKFIEVGLNDRQVITSAKKNLKRKLQTMLDGFTYINVDNKLYVYPQTLLLEDIVSSYVGMKNQLESMKTMSDVSKCIAQCASVIKKEIKEMKDEMPWPPSCGDLAFGKIKIGSHLDAFLEHLLKSSCEKDLSSRAFRLKYSFAQDIIYAVSNGQIKTPKSILFPYCIKSLTNNTELVNISCKLGHGMSYSMIEELDTENAYLCIDEHSQDGVLIPKGTREEEHTIVIFDNIDRREETLSGAGTTHKTNGVITQCLSDDRYPEYPRSIRQPKMKRSRRSLELGPSFQVKEYLRGKRAGPGLFKLI